jgi:hypothetical protein
MVIPNPLPLEQDNFSYEMSSITDENDSEETAPTVVFDLFSETEGELDLVNTNSHSSSVSTEDEMDIVLSTREDLSSVTDSAPNSQTENNPYEMSLSETEEILAARKEQRIKAFKKFNHQFNKGSMKLDEIERVPAYQRAGVEFDEVPEGSKVSRTTLSEDQNGDNQLRTNNSFLHDNVD